MDDDARPGLSDAEREALRTLWDDGPGTVRRVMETIAARGRTWAYSTVATLLRRLEAKGYAASAASDGGPLVYRATVSRDDLIERRLRDAAEELCDGQAAPLVLALVQGNRFSRDELDRIRRLIDEAKSKKGNPPTNGR